MKKFSNLMKKQGGKLGRSIDKKPLKLDKKTKWKIDHLLLCKG